MFKKTRYTWKMVQDACEAGRFTAGFCYVGYDDYGRTVLRCNNHGILASKPCQARWFVDMDG